MVVTSPLLRPLEEEPTPEINIEPSASPPDVSGRVTFQRRDITKQSTTIQVAVDKYRTAIKKEINLSKSIPQVLEKKLETLLASSPSRVSLNSFKLNTFNRK